MFRTAGLYSARVSRLHVEWRSGVGYDIQTHANPICRGFFRELMSSKVQVDATDVQAASRGVLSRFTGKAVIITGASDRGIGGAIAERLSREGAALALLSRSEPKRLLKRIDRLQGDALWTRCDVTQTEDVQEAVDKSLGQLGRIDVLVNNAGVEYARRFEHFTD